MTHQIEGEGDTGGEVENGEKESTNMKRVKKQTSKRNIGLGGIGAGAILSVMAIGFRILGKAQLARMSEWRRWGWEREHGLGTYPYSDLVEVLVVFIMVTLAIGIFFFTWSKLQRDNQMPK